MRTQKDTLEDTIWEGKARKKKKGLGLSGVKVGGVLPVRDQNPGGNRCAEMTLGVEGLKGEHRG